jgi:hypothetical protein
MLRPNPRAAKIAERFADGYTAFHAERYAYVVEFVAEHRERIGSALDVGPSVLTTLVAEALGAPIDSAGNDSNGSNTTGGAHYEFDLNRLPDDRGPADLGRYDLIVFCEVLEHLVVAPEHVFAWLRDHLTSEGVLIVQTPNAAALDRRLKLLAGRNPFDPLDPDSSGARHVRECTLGELRAYAEGAGLRVETATRRAYFDYRWANSENGHEPRLLRLLQNAVYRALPPSLRSGISLVLRQPSSTVPG